jgi:PAS domain S-box-containing protein
MAQPDITRTGADLLSESAYQTIFETTGTATVIIERNMIISLANSEFEKLSGFSRFAIEGRKKLVEFIAPRDRRRLRDYHYARRQDPGAAPRNYEFDFLDRRGHIKHIYMTIAVFPDRQRSVGSFLDITGHKQALHALAESEERFRSLVENSHTGIFIVQNEHIVYTNPEQERLFGPAPRAFTLDCLEHVHPDDRPGVQRFHRAIISPDFQFMDIEYRFYSRQGAGAAGLRWVHCRASVIDYLGKRATLVNMMDITKTRELEHLVRIKDKMISLGQVVAGIAHEIRNPLSGINVFLDAIRENAGDPAGADDIPELISQARAAAGKIESVIKRVLDFVRPGQPRMQAADIQVPVQEALLLSQVSLRTSSVSLETDLQENLPPITIDTQLIEQLILNLINNAFDAVRQAGDGGTILVRTAQEQETIRITVGDSGPGIPPEEHEKIFDPFYTTKAGGSGIGLCICRRIVHEHRGSICVGTSALGGAEFIIALPLQRQA